MTFLADVEGFFKAPGEASALKVAADIKQGIEVFESDIASGLSWIATEEPAIVSGLQGALAFAGQLGVTADPEVAAILTATNTTISVLQGITADVATGKSSAQTLVDGVVAVKTAQAAVATATATVMKAPVTPAATSTPTA